MCGRARMWLFANPKHLSTKNKEGEGVLAHLTQRLSS